MEVIFDNREAERNARKVLASMGNSVDLEDIVFVGDVKTPNTITTLPSTFPKGDLRYRTYLATIIGKQNKKSIRQISAEHGLPEKWVNDYYYGSEPWAFKSVEKAREEGILPFGFADDNITGFNRLYAFTFWTGCLSLGKVEIPPSFYNAKTIRAVIENLGYALDGKGKRYHIDKGYVIPSAQLVRVFGLLGLPLGMGYKTTIEDLAIPWYVKFMQGKYLKKGQEFDERSRISAEDFLNNFCYALLTDRTRCRSITYEVPVALMGTKSKEIGEKLTRDTAGIFMDVFPGLELKDGNLYTARTPLESSFFQNRISLYGEEQRCIIYHLAKRTPIKPDSTKHPGIQIRSLAASLL